MTDSQFDQPIVRVLGFSLYGALAYGNGMFLATGLSTSTDGVTWTTPTPRPDMPIYNGGLFNAAIYAQGRWFGVGAYESIQTHP